MCSIFTSHVVLYSSVVMVISSSRIEQGMTGDEVIDIIQDNIATLDVPVTALSTGNDTDKTSTIATTHSHTMCEYYQ